MEEQLKNIKKLIEESNINPEAKKTLLEYLDKNGVNDEFEEMVEKIYTLEDELATMEAETAEQLAEVYEEAATQLDESETGTLEELEEIADNTINELQEIEREVTKDVEASEQTKAEELSKEIQES